mmetsp:Transcript_40897/g.87103  ORF Transcript_40897/g.87103 Transcript_40897/m.87103 type:complete len:258 (+) Transcript_40897:244-1017(+)
MMVSVLGLSVGTAGQWKRGMSPDMVAVSPTVRVDTPNAFRKSVNSIIVPKSNAMSDEGTIFPILGIFAKNFMMNMHMTTCTSVQVSTHGSLWKVSHSRWLTSQSTNSSAWSHFMNAGSCAMKIMMASPSMNAIIPVSGISLTSLARRKTQNRTCMIPQMNMVMYSAFSRSSLDRCGRSPFSAVIWGTTTARAPAAPDIIPGFPPNIPVMVAIQNVAWRPLWGGTPATKLKAMDSGTCMMATVKPEMTSSKSVRGLSR